MDGGAAGALDATRQAATLACPLTPGTDRRFLPESPRAGERRLCTMVSCGHFRKERTTESIHR